MSGNMTRQELLSLPSTTTIPTAARALGISRVRAYEMAGRGEFPCKVLKLGSRYKVITSDLLAVLGLSSSTIPPGEPAEQAVAAEFAEEIELQAALRRLLEVVDRRVERYERILHAPTPSYPRAEAGPEVFTP